MATTPVRRSDPNILTADGATLNNARAIAGFQPANPTYTIAAVTAIQAAMTAAQAAEDVAAKAFAAARDDAAAAEWAFHKAVLGLKDQVIAQFGDDSNEVQSLGLKKKSEYKKPSKPAAKAKA